MKKIFISVINFNNSQATLECLESIEEVDSASLNLNVVLIDNASHEALNITKKFNNFKLELIKSDKNLGFSGGQNLGIKYALKNSADFVIILNNDTVIAKNLISELIDSFAYTNAGIISPKVYFSKGREFHKEKYVHEDLGKVLWYAGGIMDWRNILASHRGVDEVDNGQYSEDIETDFASGCCMMVKKEVFEKIGLFDEKYFLYYEDNDFSQRARKAKFSVRYNAKGVVWHKNAVSSGGSGSHLQDYYISRNRLLFAMKFASFRSKLAILKESIELIFRGRKWQKSGVIDFYLGRLGRGSFPV